MITKSDIIPVYFSRLEIGYISWMGFCRNEKKVNQEDKNGLPSYVSHQRGFSGEYACQKFLSCQIDTRIYEAGGDRSKPDAFLWDGSPIAIKTKYRDAKLVIDIRDVKLKKYAIFCWYHEELQRADLVGYKLISELEKEAKVAKLAGKPDAFILPWEALNPAKDLLEIPNSML